MGARGAADLERLIFAEAGPPRRNHGTAVRTVLKNAGVERVTEAADGGQALAEVTQPSAWFDLILCDLRMPERDGIETIRAFAALGLFIARPMSEEGLEAWAVQWMLREH